VNPLPQHEKSPLLSSSLLLATTHSTPAESQPVRAFIAQQLKAKSAASHIAAK
jgi:hypothetical protein